MLKVQPKFRITDLKALCRCIYSNKFTFTRFLNIINLAENILGANCFFNIFYVEIIAKFSLLYSKLFPINFFPSYLVYKKLSALRLYKALRCF